MKDGDLICNRQNASLKERDLNYWPQILSECVMGRGECWRESRSNHLKLIYRRIAHVKLLYHLSLRGFKQNHRYFNDGGE